MTLPKIVSQDEWLAAAQGAAGQGEGVTRRRDALNTERRELPMVEIDKEYVFDGPDGEASLLDLFEGRRQLIVVHFMFDPSWDDGCPSCTAGADEVSKGCSSTCTPATRRWRTSRARRSRRSRIQGDAGLDVPVVLVVRQRLQLRLPRHARRVRRAGRVQLPDQGRARAGRRGSTPTVTSVEDPGPSVFLRDDDRIFHTYSVYARGTEPIGGSYYLLDETALGRQEDWEEPKKNHALARKPSAGQA